MNTLENKALLYDRDCPMCNLYTGYFVNSGILGENGRIPFDEITEKLQTQIDIDRARHEIALVDHKGGDTLYGLESLFHIIGTKVPFLQPVFRFRPLQFALKGMYNMITYNRRMIAGKAGTDVCKPDFNLAWRWVYLIFALLIALPIYWVAGIATLEKSFGWILPAGVMIALGLQALFALPLKKNQRMDYLGNLATLLLISALIMLPAPLFSWLNGIPIPWMYMLAFLLGQTVMHWSHFRRIKSFQHPRHLIGTLLLISTFGLYWMLAI